MSVIQKGLVVLTPEDAIIRREIERYLSHLLEYHDYLPLYSPHIGDIKLFEKSGHYPYYKDSMFPLIEEHVLDGEENLVSTPDTYTLKPMNCPFHIQAYQEHPRSYRDLPIRYYEFGTVYRNEASGSINGMLRLRGFTQDDGHIFCTMDQVEQEVGFCVRLIDGVMKKFDMTVRYELSVSKMDLSKYVGSKEIWGRSEALLSNCLQQLKGEFEVDVGGAAFYGPKIDFIAKDKLGREWQLGTVQLDFNLPDRFALEYKSSENKIERPVMIHRALLGSIERFLAILREQGPLPLWLRLEQVRVIPVHIDQLGYAEQVCADMKKQHIRATVDRAEAPLSAKVNKCIADGVLIRAVVGKKEVTNGHVQITSGIFKFTESVDVADFINEFKNNYL